MRVFIAGIMQGSLAGNSIHSQDYRARIKAVIKRYHPTSSVFCPWDLFPDSVDYGPEKARETLLAMVEEAGRSDVVVAYLPQASMGTALEMWRAYAAGRAVLSISPLRHNWVVQCLSRHVVEDIEAFEAWVADGGLAEFDRPALRIQRGLPDALRLAAARMYYDAFRRMLASLLNEEEALAVFPQMFNAEQTLIALRGEELVGMANLDCAGRPAYFLRLRDYVRAFGPVKGLSRWAIMHALNEHAPPGEVLLESLCVAASARGQGIGTVLLDAVADFARQEGYRAVRLEVVDTNPRARRLYEREGFTAIRTRCMPFTQRWAGFSASTTMVREISAGET